MKKIILASACILAFASPTAFAQTAAQPNDNGPSSSGNVGPGTSQGVMKDGAMRQGTTGASRTPSPRGDASTSGAGTAAGVNNTGTAKEPGAVQRVPTNTRSRCERRGRPTGGLSVITTDLPLLDSRLRPT